MIYNRKKLQETISLILEGEEEDFYRIRPEDYKLLLTMTHNNPAFTKSKKFKGKPLYIDGDLDLSGRKISTLGNVIYVNGTLNLSRTDFKEKPGTDLVKGYVSMSNTPYEFEKFKRELKAKKDENILKRENGEWDGNDEVSLHAQALFKYLAEENIVDILDEDEKNELETLKDRLSNIEREYEETEDDEEVDRLSNIIDEITDRIEQLEEKHVDMYDTFIFAYRNWYGHGTVFEIMSTITYGSGSHEYSVIDSDYESEVIRDYAYNLFQDIGYDGVNTSTLEDCIDKDAVEEMARADYEEMVRESPESYFDDDEYELSPEMISRRSDLESYIVELESYIEELEEKQSSLDDEIEEPDEYSQEYDRIQGLIDEAEKRKEDTQEEIEEIENSANEVSEDAIESKIESLVSYVLDDPLDYLKNLGYSGRHLQNFVDEDCVIDSIADYTDYSDISSYNNTYDVVSVNGDNYNVMRIN